MAFFLACGGVVVSLVVPLLSAVYLHPRGREKASYVVGGGIGLLVLSAYGFVLYFGQKDSDQQALHDRGVAVTGVVTRQWKSSTPDGTSSGVFVRLPDGTMHKLSVAAVALGCAASSFCCAGFLTEDIGRRLRRKGPVDRRRARIRRSRSSEASGRGRRSRDGGTGRNTDGAGALPNG
ncbi:MULTISPECIES: hypothetical protein [unclassified Streptomyces]|uniref:hypothetical protein n=1 Tax=unclassified Streptomyces TaxID=2593676 RepID=UPI004043815B